MSWNRIYWHQNKIGYNARVIFHISQWGKIRKIPISVYNLIESLLKIFCLDAKHKLFN